MAQSGGTQEGVYDPTSAADQMNANLDTAVRSAPELANAPGAAVDAATLGGNVPNTARAVAVQGNRQVRASVISTVDGESGGILGGLFHDLGHNIVGGVKDVVGGVAKAANMGMGLIQHEYRYLHDVGAKHGMMAELGEGAALTLLFAAGAVTTGGVGDVIAAGGLLGEGAEGAGTLALSEGGYSTMGALGKAAYMAKGSLTGGSLAASAGGVAEGMFRYNDSWQRTSSNNYLDPNTGRPVSIGRDLAGFMGLKSGSQYYGAVSGVADGLFDVFGDPLGAAGKGVGMVRDLEAAHGVVGLNMAPSRLLTAESIDKAFHDPGPFGNSVRRWAQTVADSDYAKIMNLDPRLAEIAGKKTIEVDGETRTIPGLAEASTPEAVIDRVKAAVAANETLGDTIPSLSITKAKTLALARYFRDAHASTLHPILGTADPRNIAGNLGKLTTRIPGFRFNPVTAAFEPGKFNPVTMEGSRDLLAELQYGLSQSHAEEIVDRMYHAPSPVTRLTILRNARIQNLLGLSGLELAHGNYGGTRFLDSITDVKLRQNLQRFFDQLKTPYFPDAGGVYGAHMDGSAPQALALQDGSRAQGAIWEYQLGEIPLMKPIETKHIAQELAGRIAFTGKADDFVYNHVTGAMKRGLLFSLGYPLHIVFSELIPNAFRLGISGLAKGGVLSGIAKIGAKDEADRNVVEKGIYDLFGKVPKNQQHLDDMVAAVVQLNGHVVPPGIAAHGDINLVDSGDDKVGIFQHLLRGQVERRSNNFTYFTPDSRHYTQEWRTWHKLVSREPLARKTAKAMADAYARGATRDEAYHAAFQRAMTAIDEIDPKTRAAFLTNENGRVGDPVGISPQESWAHEIAKNVEAITHSPQEIVNKRLLHTLYHTSETPSLRELEAIPKADRPLNVPGREFTPIASNMLSRLATTGFQRVFNPLVTGLSRAPMFGAEYLKRMDGLRPLIDDGRLTYDQAVTRAIANTTIDSIKYVHNLHDRTQFDELVRNFAPFFFAQEQAYRRMGRLLATDPGAFRRYEIGILAAHHFVAGSQDANGNRYIIFPGSGFLGTGVLGRLFGMGVASAGLTPTGFGGTLTSANVIFPLSDGVRPDISPLVVASLQGVAGIFSAEARNYKAFAPEANKVQGVVNNVIGPISADSNWWENAIPNTTAQRLVQTTIAAFQDPSYVGAGAGSSFLSAMVNQMNTLDMLQREAESKWIADGRKGPQPQIAPNDQATANQLQDYLLKLKNWTVGEFFMRALMGFVSPVSADVVVNDYGLHTALQNDLQQYGYTKGYQKFQEQHPYASAFTTSATDTSAGEPLAETQQALNWYTANRSLVNKYPLAGMWVMPQFKAGYSATAYLTEIADGLRSRETPIEHLNNIYYAAGNETYYAALTEHENVLKAAGGDKGLVEGEYAKWDAYLKVLQGALPVWWSVFNDNRKSNMAVQTIDELRQMYAANDAPPGPQTDLVKTLLSNYDQAEQDFVQANNGPNYSTATKQVKDAWTTYLQAEVTAHPALSPIVSSVFRDALFSTNPT